VISSLVLAVGCQQPDPGTIDALIVGEVMMRGALSDTLRALSMPGGRLSGTPNAERAEAYVAQKLRAYGLKNVHFEPFGMSCWIVNDTRVTVLTDPPRALEGAVALARTLGTPPEGITAPLIDVGKVRTTEEMEAFGEELRGKLPLLRSTRRGIGSKLRAALSHGAVGILAMMPEGRDPLIGNAHRTPQPEPAVVLAHDEQLLADLEANPELQVNVRIDAESWDCRPRNVVGEIPGRGPLAHEVVVLCAHLDSWHLAEGALDNGTGSTCILETARALAAVDWQPRRTVRFIWFMAEELGLEGSYAYVRDHLDELDDVVAVINMDMPGAPRKFGTFGHPELHDFISAVLRDLRGYELAEEIGDYEGAWSDHAAFMEQGVASLTLSGELGPGSRHYHTVGDTYEIVDRRGTIHSSAVLGVLTRRLADAPERPTVRLEPDPPKEENGS
jgi:hypothetical protein